MFNNFLKKSKEMGKETKKSEKLTVDNISEETLKARLLTEDHVKKAAEKIEKDKDEKKVLYAEAVILHTEWVVADTLTSLRKSRAIEKISKETMEVVGKLEEEILGGKVPPQEFDEKLMAIYKSDHDKREEVDKEFEKLTTANDKDFSNSYRYRSFKDAQGRRPWYM